MGRLLIPLKYMHHFSSNGAETTFTQIGFLLLAGNELINCSANDMQLANIKIRKSLQLLEERLMNEFFATEISSFNR